MPNSYFRFKQFTIHQEKAALKVSTDSCLFGAWCAQMLDSGRVKVDNILDIGAGSGLLMLMLAQQSEASIHGVELDHDSFAQGMENLEASPWTDRLQLFEDDVRNHSFSFQYDFIVSNPPFFEGDFKPSHHRKLISKHADTLPLEELLHTVQQWLKPGGSFACLLPYHRWEEAVATAAIKQLHLQEVVHVRQTERHGFFRSMLRFSSQPEDSCVSEICIKEKEVYTPAFTALLRDYYLYL